MGDPRETILSVQGVQKRFGGGRRFLAGRAPVVHAVNGVSFDLYQGDSLGVVGESGCGKSTLARMIMGIIDPSAGSIHYRGRDIAALRGRERRELYRNIQFVFQDPNSSLNPRKTVREILEAPMKKLLTIDGPTRQKRVEELMDRVNMRREFLERHPHEFSGGQAQRIGIARALAVKPEILILDEPVSALDVSIQAQIIDLLKELKRDLNLTYLFISHDLAVVDHLCQRVAVMYLGEVVEEGTAGDIFETPRHPYTHVLLESVPKAGRSAADRPSLSGELPDSSVLPTGCPFAPRCYRATAHCHTSHPPLERYDGEGEHTDRRGHWAACFYGDDPRSPQEIHDNSDAARTAT